MKSKSLLLAFLLIQASYAFAQDDYIVTTEQQNQTALTEEEIFVKTDFPLHLLSNWTPGMKFMFIPTAKDKFIPIFSDYETGNEASNLELKHKIVEFIGTEELENQSSSGISYKTRFVFVCDGRKYYHEVNNRRLDEVSKDNPRRCINGLVYLKDVDTAKAILVGKAVYLQSEFVRIDDANSYAGYREVKVPLNHKMTIKKIGVGSQAYPVKIILEDENQKSYYLEVAFSRTNSGMDITDFQGAKKYYLFSHAFSFTDKKADTQLLMRDKYLNQPLYPIKNIRVKTTLETDKGLIYTETFIARYTPLIVQDVVFLNDKSLVSLKLKDENNKSYELEVDLKYDFIIKNENYIEDLFKAGNIYKQYPYITAERWKLIAQGEIKEGMAMDECRLALGNPIEIKQKLESKFETWYYNGKILEFESGRLIRFN